MSKDNRASVKALCNNERMPDKELGYLRIGELSRRVGVSPELLRAWETRYGLLRPSRSQGGFRLYSDEDEARVEQVLRKTLSGGVSVNTVMLHVLQENLPFGGVGNSGLGHYHAQEGFQTFSKMRPIFYQARFNGSFLLKPPYGRLTEGLLRLLLR